MEQGQNKEPDQAWRLFLQLQELIDRLWERYEEEFMKRHMEDMERVARMRSDAEGYPF